MVNGGQEASGIGREFSREISSRNTKSVTSLQPMLKRLDYSYSCGSLCLCLSLLFSIILAENSESQSMMLIHLCKLSLFNVLCVLLPCFSFAHVNVKNSQFSF